MKITPEDMDDVREIFRRGYSTPPDSEPDDIALAFILVRIWDRGHKAGYDECIDASLEGFDEP